MKLVSYQIKQKTAIGLLDGNTIFDLNDAYQYSQPNTATLASLPADMIALLQQGEMAWQVAQQVFQWLQQQSVAVKTQFNFAYPLEHITLLPPVLRSLKVIGIAFNYPSHAVEAGQPLPIAPLMFHKTASALVGHLQAIQLPRFSEQVDYEGELAVIIGKPARHVTEAEALDYVAGYSCANDVVARDIEAQTTWTNGAMLETFAPLGPALISRDEIPNPNQLALQTRLNGHVMQSTNTADMRFQVPYLISYLSSLITLEPGDVILTGTPPGIGALRNPPIFLKAGDVVEVEIEQLGTLINPVI